MEFHLTIIDYIELWFVLSVLAATLFGRMAHFGEHGLPTEGEKK